MASSTERQARYLWRKAVFLGGLLLLLVSAIVLSDTAGVARFQEGASSAPSDSSDDVSARLLAAALICTSFPVPADNPAYPSSGALPTTHGLRPRSCCVSCDGSTTCAVCVYTSCGSCCAG